MSCAGPIESQMPWNTVAGDHAQNGPAHTGQLNSSWRNACDLSHLLSCWFVAVFWPWNIRGEFKTKVPSGPWQSWNFLFHFQGLESPWKVPMSLKVIEFCLGSLWRSLDRVLFKCQWCGIAWNVAYTCAVILVLFIILLFVIFQLQLRGGFVFNSILTLQARKMS